MLITPRQPAYDGCKGFGDLTRTRIVPYAHSLLTCGRTERKARPPGQFLLTLFCAFLSCGFVQASPANPPLQDYVLWYRNYDSPAIYALVNLALEKTPEYGAFRLIRSQELSQGRALRELERDENRMVDIANVATSAEREQFLTPIPVPVDGGLLGFRVCVVMPDSLPLFQSIHSLEDLRESGISIGQGDHWPDTPILRNNDIPVITHSRYEILFGMLKKHRFDCFARGVSEVNYDLQIEGDPTLTI